MPIDEATILAPGTTDGLGRRVMHGLAAQGADVLMHGRVRKRVDTQAHNRAACARLQALSERLGWPAGGRPVAVHGARRTDKGALT